MTVRRTENGAPWLLLTFTLPAKRASQRVEIWRNQERFEWLAAAVRKYAGEASVVKVQSIDNLSTPQLIGRFAEARAREYQELIGELQKRSSAARHKHSPSRLRTRFREIA